MSLLPIDPTMLVSGARPEAQAQDQKDFSIRSRSEYAATLSDDGLQAAWRGRADALRCLAQSLRVVYRST
jgi:hypothetical protein